MPTVDAYVPLTGPTSDPLLYGVTLALSQIFPLVEQPIGHDDDDGGTVLEDDLRRDRIPV